MVALMPIAKRKGIETAEDRMLADRIARARKAMPPRDPTGEHHASCAAIARAAGADVADVLDAWDELAAVAQYERGTDRPTAEREAVEHVRQIYTKQGSLL
jgi:hypothetical protein